MGSFYIAHIMCL